jgi:multiple sugar transport system permease protein
MMLFRRCSLTQVPVLLGAAGILVLSLGPYLWTVLSSLRPEAEIGLPRLLPGRWTLENYTYVLRNTAFPRFVLNSSIVAAATIVLGLALAVPAAYAFSRYRFKGRQVLKFILLLCYIFPSILLVTPLYSIMHRLGLIDTYLSMIVAYSTYAVPFCVWMLLGYFDAIPPDLEEAAMVDGARRFEAFLRVILPLAMPGVVATAVFIFIFAWNEYLFALFFTTGDVVRTLPVGLQTFLAGDINVKWGAVNASAVITTLPLALVFVVAQRQLIRGLTAGAFKG